MLRAELSQKNRTLEFVQSKLRDALEMLDAVQVHCLGDVVPADVRFLDCAHVLCCCRAFHAAFSPGLKIANGKLM